MRWLECEREMLAGRTVLWVERPRLDVQVLIGRYLLLFGWASSPAGATSVEFEIAGRHRAAALTGPRSDVERAFAGAARDPVGFVAYVDLGDLRPGSHGLLVRATGAGGPVHEHGSIVVDRDAAVRAWLTSRHATRGAAEAATDGFEVVAPGDQLGEALERVATGAAPGVVAVDAGATLLPRALERLAGALTGAAGHDAAYGDGELQAATGVLRLVPRLGWSPERLLAGDIVGPVLAVGPRAAAAVLAVGARGDPPRSVYELALALCDAPVRVGRVLEPLSRERERSGEEEAAEEAALRAASRRGRRVRIEGRPQQLRDLRWRLEDQPSVSVIIPSRGGDGLLERCLTSIAQRTSYEHLEVVVVDTGQGEARRALEALGEVSGRAVSFEGPFNFSRAVNLGAGVARGELLVFLNDDTEVRTRDWLERMVELAQLPRVGVVGAKLVYPDGTVQHGGVRLEPDTAWPSHACLGAPPDAPGPDGELLVARDCAAVTGACMLVRRDCFEALGGFDPDFPSNVGDTDICLRAREAGHRVLFTPHAVLVHHESATRKSAMEEGVLDRFEERWAGRYEEGDPVEHPGLAATSIFLASGVEGSTPALPGAALDEDGPRLACDELECDGATVFAGNELALHGWASAHGGPAEVVVEVGRAQIPVARDGARFEVSVDTRGWPAGRQPVRVVARDGSDRERSLVGAVDVLPYRLCPGRPEALLAQVAAGRPVVGCDEPPLDESFEAGEEVAVRGWVHAPAGLQAVYVGVDGSSRAAAVCTEVGQGPVRWELALDLHGLRDGEHRLGVVALDQDGHAVGVEGAIRTGSQVARPVSRWLAPQDGQPDIPERFVPEEFPGYLIDAEHQARYRWAARIAGGNEVLDAACGMGYGTAVLAEAGARRVVGLDLDPGAVLGARERAGELAEFVLGDLRRLPFDDASFDLVTCFEAIEHVSDPGPVLDELRRVLRPDGVLLVSSPNREVFMPGNPHHVHEFTPDELREALSGRFAHVRLHRQHAHLASLLAGDKGFAMEGGDKPLSAEVRKLEAAPTELYTVAAASDAKLPKLRDVVTLAGLFEIRHLFEHARALEERALAAEAHAAASDNEHDIAVLGREQAEDRAEELDRERRELQARLEDVEGRLAHLGQRYQVIAESRSWRLTSGLRRAANVGRRPTD